MNTCIKCKTPIGARQKCKGGNFFSKPSPGYWRCCACIIEKHKSSTYYQKWFSTNGCAGCKGMVKTPRDSQKPRKSQTPPKAPPEPPKIPLKSDPVNYYAYYPHEVANLSADFLSSDMCIALVKTNPNVLQYLPERYRTEIVCLTAFLKSREKGIFIVDQIPIGVRYSEMWEVALNNTTSLCFDIDNIPINLVTPSIVKICAQRSLKNRFLLTLSSFTKEQRELVYPILFEYLITNKSLILNCAKKEIHLFNEMVEFIIAFQSDKKSNIDLYQFQGIELTGSQANQLGKNLKFTKLTNYTEKHRDRQYNDGKIEAIQPFEIYEPLSSGAIYFTTRCKEHMWSKYESGDIGKLYWRRSVTLPPEARVCVESDHYIKCDGYTLGPREKL